jgi:hypothetical protein
MLDTVHTHEQLLQDSTGNFIVIAPLSREVPPIKMLVPIWDMTEDCLADNNLG